MEEKLNEFLIKEIEKGIESLKKDEEQLQNEFDEYGYKNNGIINKQIQGDLKKVQEELESKEQEVAEVKEINKLIELYESKELKTKYNKLVKEQKDCIDAIKALEGKYDNINGKLVPTREQQEYERDLEKIQSSMSEIKSTALRLKREILEKSVKVNALYDKYDIKRKFKEYEESKQEKEAESKTIIPEEKTTKSERTDKDLAEKQNENDPGKENNEKDKVADSEEGPKNEPKVEQKIEPKVTEKPQQKVNGDEGIKPKVQETVRVGEGTKYDIYSLEKLDNSEKFDKVDEIYCRIINGRVQYSIEGEGKEDKLKYFVETVKPRKMSRKEKAFLKNKFSNKYLKNIDIEIVRILNRRDKEYGTELLKQYFYNIENRKAYPENCDIKIEYNLTNLRTAKLNNKAKKLLKRTAKLSEKNGIATYIRPMGRITALLGKFKQNLLTDGKLEKTQELPSREKMVMETYKSLYNEEGFNFEDFCKDMNLSREEIESLQGYEKAHGIKRNFYKSTVLTAREMDIYSTYNNKRKDKNFDFEKFSQEMNLSDKEKRELRGYEDLNKTKENFEISGNNEKIEEAEK